MDAILLAQLRQGASVPQSLVCDSVGQDFGLLGNGGADNGELGLLSRCGRPISGNRVSVGVDVHHESTTQEVHSLNTVRRRLGLSSGLVSIARVG